MFHCEKITEHSNFQDTRTIKVIISTNTVLHNVLLDYGNTFSGKWMQLFIAFFFTLLLTIYSYKNR